jgi:hypothetical protein
MDEYEDNKTTSPQPQIDDDNVMITTTKKFDDSILKLVNIIVTLTNSTIELEHISTYMLDTTKDEGVGGTMVYG